MAPITLKNISKEAYQSLNDELSRLGVPIELEAGVAVKNKILAYSKTFPTACILRCDFETAHTSKHFIAALGERHSLELNLEEGAFQALKAFCDLHQNQWKFGYLSYDLKNDVEHLSSSHSSHQAFPTLHFFVPQEIFSVHDNTIRYSGKREIATLVQQLNNLPDEPKGRSFSSLELSALTSNPGHAEYITKIDELKNEIALGNIYEVNFCKNQSGSLSIDPTATYEALNRLSPAPFSAFYKKNDQYLLCASPERFIQKSGQSLRVQPIKGTKRRVANPAEDLAVKNALKADLKEQTENVMIVDLMRNDLSKSAERGSVLVDELFGVYSFAHVHQMISTISSKLKKDIHFVDVLKDCFPMGSMTGAPKLRAMQLIETHESFKRGLFSGSVGFISPEENFDFNVVIRSIFYNQLNGMVSLPTGSAITAMCNAQSEWEECELKAEALISCLRKSE